MGGIDKHNRFDEEVFTYRVSKDKKVFIFWYGKQVMILKGKKSEIFLSRIEKADELSPAYIPLFNVVILYYFIRLIFFVSEKEPAFIWQM